MFELLIFLVACLAAYRLTRLVTSDSITEPLRELIWNRYPPNVDRARTWWWWDATTGVGRMTIRADNRDDFADRPMETRAKPRGRHPKVSRVGQLIECPWCVGFWVSGVVAECALRYTYPIVGRSWCVWFVVTLAMSTVVGLIGSKLDQ